MEVIIKTKDDTSLEITARDPSTTLQVELNQSREDIHTTLKHATPIYPGSWKAIWKTIVPYQEETALSDEAIQAELADLIYMQVFVFQQRKIENKSTSTEQQNYQVRELKNNQSLENTPIEGYDISMINGEVFFKVMETCLQGPISFEFYRIYRSSNGNNFGLGIGWSYSGNESIHLDDEYAYLQDSETRLITFDLPEIGEETAFVPEGIKLRRLSYGQFLVRTEGQENKLFTQSASNASTFQLSQIQHASFTPENKNLRAPKEESGYAINFYYDKHNRLSRIVGNWGRSITLVRDNSGRIQNITQNNDHQELSRTLVTYHYNDQDYLIAHKNAQGAIEQYKYLNHLMETRTLANGYAIHYKWNGINANSNCVSCWGDDDKKRYVFLWDLSSLCNKATDSRSYSRIYHFNEQGQLVEKTDSGGGVHWYNYQNGKKHTYTNPLGHTTQYFYDDLWLPAGIRDALGQELILNFFANQLTQIVEKDRTYWRRKYNDKGELISEIDPYNQVISYTYYDNGLIESKTDPNGRETRYAWSSQGDLIEIQDHSGFKQVFTYNPWGQLSSQTTYINGKSNGAKTLVEYNVSGTIKSLTTADGNIHQYLYNATNQITQYTNSFNQDYKFIYYKFGKLAQRVSPKGSTIQFHYDSELNLIGVINENKESMRFSYTGDGRIKRERGFDGREQQYAYDKAGNLIKHLDAGTFLTRFQYDEIGRPIAKICKHLKDESVEPIKFRYKYDEMNRLTEAYGANDYLNFEYNCLGNITRERQCKISDQMKLIKASEQSITFYNIWPGIRSGLMLPDGQRIDYRFDQNDRYTDIQHNRRTTTHVERDAFGNIREQHQGDLMSQFRFDHQGRLIKQSSFNQEKFQKGPILRFFTYDARNKLCKIKDNSSETLFQYDTLDRLIGSDHIDKSSENAVSKPPFINESYEFDTTGNLISQQKGFPGKCIGGRLVIQGNRTYTFDTRGNVIEERNGIKPSGVTRYEYNLQNQLIKITRNNQVTEYTYDPIGRRVEKKDAFGATRFLWADNLLIQESRNALKKTFIYEPQSFKPSAIFMDDTIYHYHLDVNQQVKEITNNNGELVWKFEHTSYGKRAKESVGEIENNLRGNGQYYDTESGLIYNGERYFNPAIGRYISQKTNSQSSPLNHYHYTIEKRQENLSNQFFIKRNGNRPNLFSSTFIAKEFSTKDHHLSDGIQKNFIALKGHQPRNLCWEQFAIAPDHCILSLEVIFESNKFWSQAPKPGDNEQKEEKTPMKSGSE